MAAIISDKFRIFNAQQFLESLSEGSPAGSAGDLSEDRTRMYFFVGRPQNWDTYVEIYDQEGGSFLPEQEVFVGTDYASAVWKATIRSVSENSLTVYSVFPNSLNTPALGDRILKGYNPVTSAVTGVTAVAGVYNYGSESSPQSPLDNQADKYRVFDDLIAAKRITNAPGQPGFARAVVTRYNWDTTLNTVFDMWKPDYAPTPTTGVAPGIPNQGLVGKQGVTGASSIASAKFYVMNSDYAVFKCLYNGEDVTPGGFTASDEPREEGIVNGIYEGTDGYIWKYLYTIGTTDVLRFLSTDFMPIVLPSNQSRQGTEAAAVDGSINVTLIRNAGDNLPTGTHYAPIVGDGQDGVVQLVVNAGGSITSATVVDPGQGYTYASVPLETGVAASNARYPYGLYNAVDFDSTTGNPVTVGATAFGELEPILPPQGGHGSNMELELNAKRVMTNIRLTYAEGSGDFPVDNDFRRIGILRDPLNYGTTTKATSETLNGLYAVKLENVTDNFSTVNEGEIITQVLNNGTIAKGQVVSWTLDEGSTTSGVLKYFQSPEVHTDNGVVRQFAAGTNPIIGSTSGAEGDVDAATTGVQILGVTFTNGVGTPDFEPNSGEIIYVENRRLITRAADQIEDIKLVIEF
jgi:hypothetical protein